MRILERLIEHSLDASIERHHRSRAKDSWIDSGRGAADLQRKSRHRVLEVPTFGKRFAGSTGRVLRQRRSRIYDRRSYLVHRPCCVGVDRTRLRVGAHCRSQ
jgi:hypothetical protein